MSAATVEVAHATVEWCPRIRLRAQTAPQGTQILMAFGGGCLYTASGFPLHDPNDGSQLSAALTFLRAHRGQVSPITINLGTNDLNALTASCGSDPSCYFENGPAVLNNIATNLDYILSQLRAAAPDAEIITFTNYDVAFLFDPRLAQLTEAFNSVVVSTAAASSGPVADVFGAFNGGPQPTTLCALTFVYTPLQDSHPTDLGYEVIARQIWIASDYDRLRPSVVSQRKLVIFRALCYAAACEPDAPKSRWC